MTNGVGLGLGHPSHHDVDVEHRPIHQFAAAIQDLALTPGQTTKHFIHAHNSLSHFNLTDFAG